MHHDNSHLHYHGDHHHHRRQHHLHIDSSNSDDEDETGGPSSLHFLQQLLNDDLLRDDDDDDDDDDDYNDPFVAENSTSLQWPSSNHTSQPSLSSSSSSAAATEKVTEATLSSSSSAPITHATMAATSTQQLNHAMMYGNDEAEVDDDDVFQFDDAISMEEVQDLMRDIEQYMETQQQQETETTTRRRKRSASKQPQPQKKQKQRNPSRNEKRLMKQQETLSPSSAAAAAAAVDTGNGTLAPSPILQPSDRPNPRKHLIPVTSIFMSENQIQQVYSQLNTHLQLLLQLHVLCSEELHQLDKWNIPRTDNSGSVNSASQDRDDMLRRCCSFAIRSLTEWKKHCDTSVHMKSIMRADFEFRTQLAQWSEKSKLYHTYGTAMLEPPSSSSSSIDNTTTADTNDRTLSSTLSNESMPSYLQHTVYQIDSLMDRSLFDTIMGCLYNGLHLLDSQLKLLSAELWNVSTEITNKSTRRRKNPKALQLRQCLYPVLVRFFGSEGQIDILAFDAAMDMIETYERGVFKVRQCMFRTKFSHIDDQLLAMGLKRFDHLITDDIPSAIWEEIARDLIPDRDHYQCLDRYKNIIKRGQKDNPIKLFRNPATGIGDELCKQQRCDWILREEYTLLVNGIRHFGYHWHAISRELLPHLDPLLLKRAWVTINPKSSRLNLIQLHPIELNMTNEVISARQQELHQQLLQPDSMNDHASQLETLPHLKSSPPAMRTRVNSFLLSRQNASPDRLRYLGLVSPVATLAPTTIIVPAGGHINPFLSSSTYANDQATLQEENSSSINLPNNPNGLSGENVLSS